jgi:RNA polymerase sigma factor (TIGR02999 family)
MQLANERKGHTFSKTALVHEAYIKLVDLSNIEWQDRAHFYAIAAKAMRQILVDYARKKKAEKRGGNRQRIPLQEDMIDLEQHAEEIIALNDLIDKMNEFDERKSKVVEMRFFAGMTIREIAELLNVSTRTVDRDWLKARTWLYKELRNI